MILARLAAIALVLVTSAGVQAAPVLVAVAGGAGPAVREAATRVRAELAAAGVAVVAAVDLPAEDWERAARQAVDEAGAVGGLALRDLPGQPAFALWAFHAASGRTVAQQVALAGVGAHAPSVLALRGLEVLRACLLELALPRPAGGPAPAPPVQKWVAAGLAPPTPRGVHEGLGLGVAASGLHSLEGIGPAFAPALRVSWGRGRLAGRVTAVVAGTEVRVGGARGRADVRQDLGTAELLFSPSGARSLQPFVAAGAGLYHVRVRGEADAPWTGATPSLWTAAGVLGGGLTYRIGARVAVVAEASWLSALRAPVVRIDVEEKGRVGRLSLLASVGVASTF